MASKQYEAASPAKPKKKSVKIAVDDVEVIEVGEKHGPLFNAIPRMPIPLAVVCCILNIFVPGLERDREREREEEEEEEKKTSDFLSADCYFARIRIKKHMIGYTWRPVFLVEEEPEKTPGRTTDPREATGKLSHIHTLAEPETETHADRGTLISSFTVFCGFTSNIKNRMKAFLLNLLSAFLQMLTFLVIVGWIWSILWGMNFIQIAMNADKKDKANLTPYYCRRQSSVDVPIL